MPKKDHKKALKYCRKKAAQGELEKDMDSCVYGTMHRIAENRKKSRKKKK